MMTSCIRIAAIACAGFLVFQASAFAQGAIDNSALSSKEFREHKRTFGLVYTLPAEISDLLAKGLLRGLNFKTPDLDGTFDRVQATGAEVVQEPMDQSYGRDCAFRDPAGNMIRILQTRG